MHLRALVVLVGVLFVAGEAQAAVTASNPTPPLAFGDTRVGSPQTKTIRLNNTSTTAPVSITAFNFPNAAYTRDTGTGSGDDCGPTPISLAANAFCTLAVKFAPTTTGTGANGNLQVANNSANINIALTGNGVPALSASNPPPPLAFGDTRVGTPQTKTIQLNNTSTSASVNITAFNFPNASYTRDTANGSGDTCGPTFPITLVAAPMPASSCTLAVKFAPTTTGTATNGNLQVVNSSVNINIALTGNGVQSVLSPTTGSLDFANVQLGVDSTKTFVITNNGTTSLNFNVAPFPTDPAALSDVGAADYSVTGCTGAVAPTATCTLSVKFTPSTLGSRPATLTVRADAANTPLTITLSGTGVALPDPTIITLPLADFQDTVVGQTQPVTQTITIKNTRTRTVTYSTTAPTDFEIANESCPTRVVPGTNGSCTFEIRFHPGITGGESRRAGNFAFTFTPVAPDPTPATINVAVAGNAILPLQVSATTVSPATSVGTPVSFALTLTNRSSSTLTISGLVYSGTAAADYARDTNSSCTSTKTLTAGASCTLTTIFSPQTTGARNAVLTITHNATGSPQTVAINGTASATPQAVVAVTTSTVVFPATVVGASANRTVTLQNTGNAALAIASLDVSGTDAAAFARTGTCAPTGTLNAGTSCTLIITFTPTFVGAHSASLTVVSNASNDSVEIRLAGSGEATPAPATTVSPTSVTFGAQTLGVDYAAARIRLTNSGNANLTVGAITLSDPVFTDVSATACSGTLAPGAFCTIDIKFTPTAVHTSTGTLSITTNASASPVTVALLGSGTTGSVAALVLSPVVSTLEFGAVSAGAVSDVQSLTLRNRGPGSLTLDSFTISGASNGAFAVTEGSCAVNGTLAESATCTVGITYTPSTAEAQTANFQATSSAGSITSNVVLSGGGIAAPVTNSTGTEDDSGCASSGAPGLLTLAAIAACLVRTKRRGR